MINDGSGLVMSELLLVLGYPFGAWNYLMRATRTILNGEVQSMRSYHVIAVAAVILIVIGAKLFFFLPAVEAKRDAVKSAGMNIFQTEHDAAAMKMPEQKINDMTFVYSDDVPPER